jgi:hypothetical protein
MLNQDIIDIYKECDEFKYFETANGVPIPFNDTWSKIGINMSGGADSAILCYNICNYILKNKLDITVHTISHVRGWQVKPWQRHVRLDVIKKLKSMFATIKFIEHENYIPTEIEYSVIGDIIPIDDELKSGDKIENSSYALWVGYTNNLDALYCSTTRNPNFLSDIKDIAPDRTMTDINLQKKSLVYRRENIQEHPLQIQPFIYHTKEEVIADYFLYDIEYLLDTTRSCEGHTSSLYKKSIELGIKNLLVDNQYLGAYKYYNVGDIVPECGECFWCLERSWAIDKAKKMGS